GVKQDWQKAVEWYAKAAEQGDAVAQCNLGICYANGQGVKQDRQKAIEWYTKAAQQGDEYAKEALKRLR
ncbi:MAG TPA: sel1 repeat family protein, partial [Candidatus Ornithoclostridium faecigallinarum]|nr:sel1 repeat family protein [Candidatus Ornithoclostridium faecigallinarum]